MQRPATRQSRGINSAEKRHMSWIKDRMICAACKQYGPVICHHAEGSAFKHQKVLVGHLFVLGLCQSCDDIVTHQSRRAFRDSFGAQSGLWVEQFADYPAQDEFSPEEIEAIAAWQK